jgi:hypothetical protein
VNSHSKPRGDELWDGHKHVQNLLQVREAYIIKQRKETANEEMQEKGQLT